MVDFYCVAKRKSKAHLLTQEMKIGIMSVEKHDIDPIETQEWLDALSSVLENEGSERAYFVL